MSQIKPEWLAIKRDYRAGILSLRAIATREGISHVAISKRAKKEGWTRDLRQQVIDAAKNKVLRDIAGEVTDRVTTPYARMREDGNQAAEVIEVTATAIANCLRDHRRDISRCRALVSRLLDAVTNQIENPELFEQLGDLLCKPDEYGNDKLNQIYRKVISLPGLVDSAKKLAETLKILITLEREAIRVDAPPPPEKLDEPAQQKTIIPVIDVQALFAKVRGRNDVGTVS